jgi:hypothetical protein
VSDDNAVGAMGEYGDDFAFAEWDPNRANVISLDYERRGTYGPEYVSIDVNLATGRVVEIREWVGPQ